MDYLKPIDTLEKQVSTQKKLLFTLIGLLAVSLTLVPYLSKESNPVLVQTETGIVLSKVEPWKLTLARIEGFTKAYLSSRFEWDEVTFEQQKKSLSGLVATDIFSKLKDSLGTFESIAKNQKARSLYVIEKFSFSNGERRAEVHLTRVLRIQDAALATPLIIRLTLTETEVSANNPFGLKVSAVDEAEIKGRD